MHFRFKKQWLGLCILLLGLCVMDVDLFGRAGGGGGYSGGGGGGSFGGGGGSFGGGYGGGGGRRWSDMSAFEKVFTVTPFFCFTLIVLLAKYKELTSDNLVDMNDGESGFDRVNMNRHQDLEQQVKEVDSGFNGDMFCARFQKAFVMIQDAWQFQKMESVRPFVTDGIFERFSLQIQEQIDHGYRDFMDAWKIHDACLADFRRGSFFEVLTVQVNASVVDYRVDRDTGGYLSGFKTRQCFTEYWSFIRRLGTASLAASEGLFEGLCPNCHTPIQINQSSECPSCRAHLRSGEYDWVLSEITQACEWTSSGGFVPVSVEKFQTLDPGFNLQHIEDRTSVIFWRKVYADRIANIGPLLKMAIQEYCAGYRKRFDAQGDGVQRAYYGDCAVGSVDCLGVIQRDEGDFALMGIKWAGYLMRVKKDGDASKEEWSRKHSLFVLMRQKGVQTNLSTSILSAHCPACGAAESDVTSHACQYCGAVLNDGAHDWVLVQDCSFGSYTALEWRQSLEKLEEIHYSARSSLDLTEWLIQVVAADGLMQSEEQEAILKLCAKQGLDEGHARGLMQAATQRHGEEIKPPDTRTCKLWLEAVADIALADGEVSDEEKAVLLKLGAYMGWSKIDINLLINKRRALL